MRRRDRVPSSAAPERLRRYSPVEWSSVDAWREACLEWLREDSGRRLPFGDHGDELDVIRESARLKREGSR